MPDVLAALPAAERERSAVLGDDNAALGDTAWFLRGALTLPSKRGAPAIIYRAWCAVDRRAYKRALALWRDPRRADQPPIQGALASTLPALPGSLGTAVVLTGAPPGRPLGLRAIGGDLARLQRDGVGDALAASLVAAALHG